MQVIIEFENINYANPDGIEEIKRVFNDIIERLGSYWNEAEQSYEVWGNTTLIIYDKKKNEIGKFYAKSL